MLRQCGSDGAVLECTVEFRAGNSMYSMIETVSEGSRP